MLFDVPPPVVFSETPPAIVYDVPSNNFAMATEEVKVKQEKEPISVMAFGMADPNLGVFEENTKVHFYDHYDITKNAKILHRKGIAMQYSSLVLYVRGHSSVKVEFNLNEEDLSEDLGLYLTHLSSDLHRGKVYDSAIKIYINDQMYVEKYVPPSHDWISDDRFDLSDLVKRKVLKAGLNTIEIKLHNEALSNYWIHCIKIK